MCHYVRAPTSTHGRQIRIGHQILLGNTSSDIHCRCDCHLHRMSPLQVILAGGSRSRYLPSLFSPNHPNNQGSGSCSKGIIQLEVFSALNMATDLMLIALPLPSLIKIQRPLIERLRLVALFLVGLTIVAVTMTRLLMNVVLFHRSGQSHNVANVEILFEAFVANAPTIYGLLNSSGRRRGTAGAQYLPDSYIGSKSGGGIGSSASRSRGLDSSNYQTGHNLHSQAWGGKSRYVNDSDEEMMIVSPSHAHVIWPDPMVCNY
jgi:hypothetical protein